MGVRDDVMANATQLARADGRSSPAVIDLFRAGMARSSSDQIAQMLPMFDLGMRSGSQQADPPAAADEKVDEIFRRAGALAIALDQRLAPDHVAAIAARDDDLGSHSILAVFRHVLVAVVAGPDPEEQQRLVTSLRDEQADEEWSHHSIGSFTSVPLRATTELGEDRSWEQSQHDGPRCSGCRRPFQEPLPVAEIETEAGPVDVVMCSACGQVLGLHGPS